MNEPTDTWQDINPTKKEFTFDQQQKKNRTRARLDYYLISKTTSEIVSDNFIDYANNLKDHKPLHLIISPFTILRGRFLFASIITY